MPSNTMVVHQSSPRTNGPVVMSSSASSSNPSAFRTVLNTGIRGLSGRLQSYGSTSSSSTNSFTTNNSQYSTYSSASSSSYHQSTIFPESLTVEKRLERYSYRLSQIRISPYDVQRVTNDDEQFSKLQESLRNQHCITDSFIRQTYYNLIRDRVKEMRPIQQSQQLQQLQPHVPSNSITSTATTNTGQQQRLTHIGNSNDEHDDDNENANQLEDVTNCKSVVSIIGANTQPQPTSSYDDDDSIDLQEIDSEYNIHSSTDNINNNDSHYKKTIIDKNINNKENILILNPSPTSVIAIKVPSMTTTTTTTTTLLSSKTYMAPTLENDDGLIDDVNINNSDSIKTSTAFRTNATTMRGCQHGRSSMIIDSSEDDDIQSTGDCDECEEDDADDNDKELKKMSSQQDENETMNHNNSTLSTLLLF
jgi:hypothetical protein